MPTHLLALLVAIFGLWGPASSAPGLATYAVRVQMGNATPADSVFVDIEFDNATITAAYGDLPCRNLYYRATCNGIGLKPGVVYTITVVADVRAGDVFAHAFLADSAGEYAARTIHTTVEPVSPAQSPSAPSQGVAQGLSTATYRDNRLPACPLDVRYWGGVCPVPLGVNAQ